MGDYIRVAEDEQVPEDAIELPSDEDGTILLSTIQAQFPGSTGLRYRNEETQAWRGVRLADGVLYPPPNGWGDALYIVVSSKTGDSSSKRKYEESPTAREPNPKQMRNYTMETDDDYLGDLIVLGLSWKAKDEDIKEYFTRFGELDFYEVKRSPTSGQSRGFAFIRFKDSEVAKNVLSRSHTILDRRVDIRLSKGKDDAPRKIFIGRLPSNCTATDIRTYFEKYGVISDVYVPQPYRQFGFVTFASGEVAREVISRNHIINGARVNVVTAEPKPRKGFLDGSPGSGSRGGSRGFGWNNMGYGDRNAGAFGNPMNAMWNLAAMSSMAQGMGAGMGVGLGGGMGGGMAGGMAGNMGGAMAGNMGGGGMAGNMGGGGMAGTMSGNMGGNMVGGMGGSMAGGMGGGMNMAAMTQNAGMGSQGMSTNMSNMSSSNMSGGNLGGSAMESGMSNNMNGAVNNDSSYALWNRETSRS